MNKTKKKLPTIKEQVLQLLKSSEIHDQKLGLQPYGKCFKGLMSNILELRKKCHDQTLHKALQELQNVGRVDRYYPDNGNTAFYRLKYESKQENN